MPGQVEAFGREAVSRLPLVSAIVPAFNAESYLVLTLESLARQTYSNLEIIVVDDGSTDGTVRCVHAMIEQHPRIRLTCQDNCGVAAARNHGIKQSRGELIAFVDADDLWFVDALNKLVQRLLACDSRTGVAYGWSVTIDADGRLDGRFRCSGIEGDVFNTLVCHNFLGSASTALIRRQCLEDVGVYDETFRSNHAQGCEDWDLYLRIARRYRFTVVPEFLFAYRRRRGAMSSRTMDMAKSHRYLLEKLKRNDPGVPGALCSLSRSSYYLRIARDYYHDQQLDDSLAWLASALRASPTFTLLRLAFYALLLKNLGARARSSLARLASSQPTSAPLRLTVTSLSDIQDRRAAIAAQRASQATLHQLVKFLTVFRSRRHSKDRLARIPNP